MIKTASSLFVAFRIIDFRNNCRDFRGKGSDTC